MVLQELRQVHSFLGQDTVDNFLPVAAAGGNNFSTNNTTIQGGLDESTLLSLATQKILKLPPRSNPLVEEAARITTTQSTTAATTSSHSNTNVTTTNTETNNYNSTIGNSQKETSIPPTTTMPLPLLLSRPGVSSSSSESTPVCNATRKNRVQFTNERNHFTIQQLFKAVYSVDHLHPTMRLFGSGGDEVEYNTESSSNDNNNNYNNINNNHDKATLQWKVPNPDNVNFLSNYSNVSNTNNTDNNNNNKTLINVTTATCQYLLEGNPFHMAHGSQQLFRCVAWWISHPNLPRFLVWPGMPKKRKKTRDGGLLHPYLVGMKQALVDAFHVTIVKEPSSILHHNNSNNTDRSGEENDTSTAWIPRVSALMTHTTLTNKYPHFAMQSPGDAAYFRDSVLDHYQLKKNRKSKAAGCHAGKTSPIIGIIDRAKDRRILNVQELANRVSTELFFPRPSSFDTDTVAAASVEVEVVYFENKTFQEQLQYMSQHDLLFSSHGAQLVSIPFLPDCGGVLEFFQPSYFIPYYFGGLAAMSGLNHAYLYTGGGYPLGDVKRVQQAKRPGIRRQEVRLANICLDVDAALEGIRTMMEQWKTCCTTKLVAAGTDVVSTSKNEDI
jgi:hypothetical protein